MYDNSDTVITKSVRLEVLGMEASGKAATAVVEAMHIPLINLVWLGTILTLLIIFVTGLFTANIVGQRLIGFWEGLLGRIPVVKSIYYSVKQVSDTLFSGSGEAFRKVLLVRYPHPQAWSLAFQTVVPGEVGSRFDEDHVGVFIPTTPSPVNGFYFFVKKSEVIELDISVDQALKYIVSMGVAASPEKEEPAAVYAGN